MNTAQKAFGQNFLLNPRLARKFIEQTNPRKDDVYLEIGPGRGALTFELCHRVKKVICVEIDPFLCDELKELIKSKGVDNIEIVNEDFMKYELELSDNPTKFKVIGALPYNNAKRMIRKILKANTPRPEAAFFIIQKEVAENYTTKHPKKSFLSNWAEIYSNSSILFNIGRENFRPKPRVDSTAIKFDLKKEIPSSDEFEVFLKLLFSKPRRTVRNNLRAVIKADNDKSIVSIIPDEVLDKRPESLSFKELNNLFLLYNRSGNEKTEK